MKFKQFVRTYPVVFTLLIFTLAISIFNIYFNPKIAACEIALVLILTAVALFKINSSFTTAKKAVASLNDCLSAEETKNLDSFPLPVLVFDSEDKILWYNRLFDKSVLSGNQIVTDSVTEYTEGRGIAEISNHPIFNTVVGDKKYTVHFSNISSKKTRAYALYFVDDTLLKNMGELYEKSKPVVSLVAVDSLEDVLRANREKDYTRIYSSAENLIENWFTSYNGIFRALGNGRFVAITSEGELEKMCADKFSVLEKVRNLEYDSKKAGLTLSIGVGRAENIADAESNAVQALDMAQGRGGDQAAIRGADENYQFFGGVSGGLEKRTKIRSRVMASALSELIKTADNVLIMGHKFSDLDALGASIGVLCICQALGKDARIVISKKTSLATPLIEHLKENKKDGYLIEPQYAEDMINDKTLLVIVDTLRKDFVDSQKVFSKAKQIVVIDHHRKTVDYIQNAVLFFHEPKASSASEMVTELMEYTPEIKPDATVSNSLLAGIMLDTKNFVLRTSTATFEAAAYLREHGADTVTVKRFFNNSLENQKLRGQIVLSAYEFKNCAIALADIKSKEIRLICAQAADELLTINNVNASFVLFKTGDTVNVSARSLGNINVQVIMEKFGGGGHQTMAACQIEDADIQDVKNSLEDAIKEYMQEA